MVKEELTKWNKELDIEAEEHGDILCHVAQHHDEWTYTYTMQSIDKVATGEICYRIHLSYTAKIHKQITYKYNYYTNSELYKQ